MDILIGERQLTYLIYFYAANHNRWRWIDHCHRNKICSKWHVLAPVYTNPNSYPVWDPIIPPGHCWNCSSSYFPHILWLMSRWVRGLFTVCQLGWCLFSELLRDSSPGPKKHSAESKCHLLQQELICSTSPSQFQICWGLLESTPLPQAKDQMNKINHGYWKDKGLCVSHLFFVS